MERKSGSDKEREVMVDQRSTGKIAVSKAQRIGGGVIQKDKQQETLKQLQDQLTEERDPVQTAEYGIAE